MFHFKIKPCECVHGVGCRAYADWCKIVIPAQEEFNKDVLDHLEAVTRGYQSEMIEYYRAAFVRFADLLTYFDDNGSYTSMV